MNDTTARSCEVEIARILQTMQRSTPSPPPLKKRKVVPSLQQADQSMIQKALPCKPPLPPKSFFNPRNTSSDKLPKITKQVSPRSILDVADENTVVKQSARLPSLRHRMKGNEAANIGISPIFTSVGLRYLLALHAFGSNPSLIQPLACQSSTRTPRHTPKNTYCHPEEAQSLPGDICAPVQKVTSENIPLCVVVGSGNEATKVPTQSLPSRKRNASGAQKVKLCRMDQCNEPAARRTPYCSTHSGPRRCEKEGCNKCAQGRTRYCIAHGGGRRCTVNGCNKGARDRLFCAGHGGGRRCSKSECTKLAVDNSGLCTAHGGGRRCQSSGCPRSAQSNTTFCVRHGGGRKCSVAGCSKVARGRSGCCMLHARSQQQKKN